MPILKVPYSVSFHTLDRISVSRDHSTWSIFFFIIFPFSSVSVGFLQIQSNPIQSTSLSLSLSLSHFHFVVLGHLLLRLFKSLLSTFASSIPETVALDCTHQLSPASSSECTCSILHFLCHSFVLRPVSPNVLFQLPRTQNHSERELFPLVIRRCSSSSSSSSPS
jgi:hypothetical protein